MMQLQHVQCFQNDPVWPIGSDIPDENIENSRIDNTNWCACSLCVSMPTLAESLCCHELDDLKQHLSEEISCISQLAAIKAIILSEAMLTLMIRFHGKVSASQFKEHKHRYLRKAAYRSFTVWAHGFLGPRYRLPIPSCIVKTVRSTFPDPEGKYTGFFYAEDIDAADMALDF
ncbi:hypothetical protein XELAEV_18028911mg [Xenopus laevis]|nr:hypothetical protein XELAEV_18028911mg [Xenopus laevis]